MPFCNKCHVQSMFGQYLYKCDKVNHNDKDLEPYFIIISTLFAIGAQNYFSNRNSEFSIIEKCVMSNNFVPRPVRI